MKTAIVYSSTTGNTEQLANAIVFNNDKKISSFSLSADEEIKINIK